MKSDAAKDKARISQDKIGALYDRLAFIYDAWGALTESRARKRALSLARIENGQQVLEVAVGTGLAFQSIVRSNTNGRNVGIDISAGMLRKARHKLDGAGLTNYELRNESALNIQEPEAAFDLVFCNYFFDLLAEDNWKNVLSEFKRVLKPAGKLVLVNMTFGEKPGSHLYANLYRISPSLMGGCRAVNLSPVLEQQGFRVLQREYCQQCLFPSEILVAEKGG